MIVLTPHSFEQKPVPSGRRGRFSAVLRVLDQDLRHLRLLHGPDFRQADRSLHRGAGALPSPRLQGRGTLTLQRIRRAEGSFSLRPQSMRALPPCALLRTTQRRRKSSPASTRDESRPLRERASWSSRQRDVVSPDQRHDRVPSQFSRRPPSPRESRGPTRRLEARTQLTPPEPPGTARSPRSLRQRTEPSSRSQTGGFRGGSWIRKNRRS